MLGELQVVDGDVDVPIRGAKQRLLLLLLLVRARETVQAERLADELWGEDPPGRRRQRAAGARLEAPARLGPAERAPCHRLPAATGSMWRTKRSMLGASRRQPRGDGTRCAAGAVDDAARELGDALDLWRGPPLDGDDDEGPLRREAVRLDELRWAVLEDRIDADLQRGHHAELVAELEQLVGEAPLRERLHGFLMLALYRAGPAGRGAAAYQHARDVLGEELGLDPGPELQALSRRSSPRTRPSIWSRRSGPCRRSGVGPT